MCMCKEHILINIFWSLITKESEKIEKPSDWHRGTFFKLVNFI